MTKFVKYAKIHSLRNESYFMFRNEFWEQKLYLIEHKISCAAPAFILCSADIHLHKSPFAPAQQNGRIITGKDVACYAYQNYN